MCGRYSVLTEDEISEVRAVIKNVSLKLARDAIKGYAEMCNEIAPTQVAPIVTSSGDEMAFERARFGFRKWDGKGVIINARAETLRGKPMFKKHLQNGRCIVPAPGYYEWKTEQGREKGVKHLIKDEQGHILFMAGLWREGADGREFVIITKEPVGAVADIHDRMPVMLRANQIEDWLNGSMPVDALAGLAHACMAEPCVEPEKNIKEESEQMRLF